MTRAPNTSFGISDKTVKVAVSALGEGLTRLNQAESDEQKFDALVDMFARLQDIMTIPVVRAAFAKGMAKAAANVELTPQILVGLRKAAGLSQELLAKAIGVTQPNIAQWERGERMVPKSRVPAILTALATPASPRTVVPLKPRAQAPRAAAGAAEPSKRSA